MLVYYNKDKIRCDCGSIIKEASLTMHLTTTKHKKFLEKQPVEFRKNHPKDHRTCTCGLVLRYTSMIGHKKSKKHKTRIDRMENDRQINMTINFNA
jgi:hypothetical protein